LLPHSPTSRPDRCTRARRNDLPGFDFRIRVTRWGCTAPCKEQAGNREHSFAPVFYTHRLVLGSDQPRILLCASSGQNTRPLPALMLRSIAARRVCKGFNNLAALRCVSKHEGAPDHSSSSFETRVRTFALAARSRMRAPQDEDEHASRSGSRCQTASLLRSRGAFLRPDFCIFASLTPIEGGRSAERRSGAAAPVGRALMHHRRA
jgi:hypothetical protein